MGPYPSRKSSASSMEVRSIIPVSTTWRLSKNKEAPHSVYLSYSGITVTIHTPTGTTSESMIPTVSLGCPMPNINPSTSGWRQIKSTSVSSQQTLITPIWIQPHNTNHQHILLEILNPFNLQKLDYNAQWSLDFIPLHASVYLHNDLLN